MAAPTVTDSFTGGNFSFTFHFAGTDTAGVVWNSATPPTNAGTYTVTVTAENDDYYGMATATLEIGRATLTITGVQATNRVYDRTVNVAITGGTLQGVLGSKAYLVLMLSRQMYRPPAQLQIGMLEIICL